jgi:hypothetical protein
MMKKSIAIVFSILCLFCSCTKDSNGSLTGKWEWVKSSGGISGRLQTPASTGKNVYLEISSNRIKSFENGNLVLDYEYSIQTKKSLLTNVEQEMIVDNQNNNIPQTFIVKGTTLYLNDECFDCYQSVYLRR